MTNAEIAVLGLIVERPRHAYEVDQTIGERGMRNWTDVGFSSIYYLLRKMERSGLVEARLATGDRGPARTIYTATPEGLAAWAEASLEALATPDTKMPFLLGLTAIGALPADRRLDAARSCLGALEERLEDVAGKRKAAGEVEWFVGEVLDYSEQSLRFARDWVAGLVGRLELRDGAM